MRSDTCDWQPSAALERLRQRAQYIQQIRQFFLQRGYLEVETPAMAACGSSDAYLDNITACFRQQSYFLQTSPEYHMKRLLAAGSGPIFQLAKVFRDDELGRWHNPEFTMLEWYRPGIDHHQLLDEVESLLQGLIPVAPMRRVSYRELFLHYCQLDPFEASILDFRKTLQELELEGILPESELNRDQYLFLLLAQCIEPALAQEGELVAVLDFPASQAALAKVEAGRAQRFEVYYAGVELANGFHELTDAALQRQRFQEDHHQRVALGKAPVLPDHRFLAALSAGLPPCSGVALGVDRVLAMALGVHSIAEVMAFGFECA
ncbi:MAG: EF-P lysine aminoacylase GenX [Legionellaceae bacterium]|nr:EF-P lysine aminoacylase GenX [Legionellaceae bacterium]